MHVEPATLAALTHGLESTAAFTTDTSVMVYRIVPTVLTNTSVVCFLSTLVCKEDICIALYNELISELWHVLMRKHSFTCHPHVYLQME